MTPGDLNGMTNSDFNDCLREGIANTMGLLRPMLSAPKGDPTGQAARACGRGLTASSEHSDLFPVPENGWIPQSQRPAPEDGTEIVIVANLATSDGEGSYSVEPICTMACYDSGEWVESVTGMAICQCLGDELQIRFWIAPPNGF